MKTIYLDMDGVLVDFDTHFYQLHGIETKELKEDNVRFWQIFDTKRDGFFRDCPPMQGHLAFVREVEALAKDWDYKVEILTALPRRSTHPTAAEEKQDWLHLNGLSHLKMNTGPYAIDKQKWHKPGDILIDDNHRNIEQWIAKGGSCILHDGSFERSLQILRAIA